MELLRIANYFNVSIEWLLTGDDSHDRNLTPSAWEKRCRDSEMKLGIVMEALKGILHKIDNGSY